MSVVREHNSLSYAVKLLKETCPGMVIGESKSHPGYGKRLRTFTLLPQHQFGRDLSYSAS